MPAVTRSVTRARDRSKRMSVLRIKSAGRARRLARSSLRAAKLLRDLSAGFPPGSYWANVHDYQSQLAERIRPEIRSADAAHRQSIVQLAQDMVSARQARWRRRPTSRRRPRRVVRRTRR